MKIIFIYKKLQKWQWLVHQGLPLCIPTLVFTFAATHLLNSQNCLFSHNLYHFHFFFSKSALPSFFVFFFFSFFSFSVMLGDIFTLSVILTPVTARSMSSGEEEKDVAKHRTCGTLCIKVSKNQWGIFHVCVCEVKRQSGGALFLIQWKGNPVGIRNMDMAELCKMPNRD